MARTSGLLRLCVSLVIVGAGVVGLGSTVRADPSPIPGVGIGTVLPPGWELCVLQGVGAPATQDNVADLDEWQVAEGGSTNNTAAYNPFNTRQLADASGAALPVVVSSNGFPAFSTWAAGCAATVATLLQPNMAPIETALKAGNISPPGVFLTVVDQSQWCAPSADGVPCYTGEILAGAFLEALGNSSPGQFKDTLALYSRTTADLSSYEEGIAVTATDQALLKDKTQQLAAIENEVPVAQGKLSVAARGLRHLALDDYTNGQAVNSDADLQLFGAPSERGVLVQVFTNVATSVLIDRYDRAEAVVKTLASQRRAAAESVAQAASVLVSAQETQRQALSRFEADMKSIEAALTCAVSPPPSASASSPVSAAQEGATQLWAALQACLASSAPLGALTSGSVPSLAH
jgi:hypothetical protein